DRDVGEGDGGPGVAVVTGGAGGSGGKMGVELAGCPVGAVVVGLAARAALVVGSRPGAGSFLGEPAGTGGRGEPFQEPQRDGAVDGPEQADGAGERDPAGG